MIAVYNLARKFLPHRLQDIAIDNIMYAVMKTPYSVYQLFLNINLSANDNGFLQGERKFLDSAGCNNVNDQINQQ